MKTLPIPSKNSNWGLWVAAAAIGLIAGLLTAPAIGAVVFMCVLVIVAVILGVFGIDLRNLVIAAVVLDALWVVGWLLKPLFG